MASLPEDPLGTDLEDFVAAHLAARGAFVETGVTERDPEDILELDIVWTDYRVTYARRIPIEIKSGDWGLGDLFKFFGWTKYLSLSPGLFICRRLPGRVNAAVITRLSERTGIAIVHLAEIHEADERFAIFGLPPPAHQYLSQLWRFSFAAQRRLLRSLGEAIRQQVCVESARIAKDYFKLINDAIFFEPDVRVRVGRLVEAHLGHTKLALTAATEVEGRGFILDDPPEDSQAFRRALFDGYHFPVQSCLFLAHRARVALIKAAVDYVIALREGTLEPRIIKIFEFEFDASEAGLHQSFRNARDYLQGSPTVQQYPVFWQTFLWAWGGFILDDRREQEYAALSAQTHVPAQEIDRALGLFDILFPTPGGWLVRPANDIRRVMKLMPAAIRGIGAFSRQLLYGVDDYARLGFTAIVTGRLRQDHNSAVRLLEADGAGLVD